MKDKVVHLEETESSHTLDGVIYMSVGVMKDKKRNGSYTQYQRVESLVCLCLL
jgi:hypothetical protein